MTPEDIAEMYRYDRWANERIVAPVLSLSQEQFTRHLGGSYPTIRDAFAHIIAGEWIWLERWRGINPSAAPEWVTSTDALALTAKLREIDADRASFLAGLSDDDLGATCSFTFLNGNRGSHTLRVLLVHVVNHSTFHRGQVVSMLRQVGNPALPTDFIVYRDEVGKA